MTLVWHVFSFNQKKIEWNLSQKIVVVPGEIAGHGEDTCVTSDDVSLSTGYDHHIFAPLVPPECLQETSGLVKLLVIQVFISLLPNFFMFLEDRVIITNGIIDLDKKRFSLVTQYI